MNMNKEEEEEEEEEEGYSSYFPPSLRHLGLQGNRLTDIPDPLLVPLTQLTHLHISDNLLTRLPTIPGR